MPYDIHVHEYAPITVSKKKTPGAYATLFVVNYSVQLAHTVLIHR